MKSVHIEKKIAIFLEKNTNATEFVVVVVTLSLPRD